MKHARKTKMKASLGRVAKMARNEDRYFHGGVAPLLRIGARSAVGLLGGAAAGGVGSLVGYGVGMASGVRRELRRMHAIEAHNSRKTAADAQKLGLKQRAEKYRAKARQSIKNARKLGPGPIERGIDKLASVGRRLVKKLVRRSDGHKQTYWTKSTSCKMKRR